jgi:hypothetical protein
LAGARRHLPPVRVFAPQAAFMGLVNLFSSDMHA